MIRHPQEALFRRMPRPRAICVIAYGLFVWRNGLRNLS